MGELVVAVTDEHVGPAGHTCMHSIIAKQKAKGRVVGIGRHRADGITGVDVFQGDVNLLLSKKFFNLLPEIMTDIAQFRVTGGIRVKIFRKEFL